MYRLRNVSYRVPTQRFCDERKTRWNRESGCVHGVRSVRHELPFRGDFRTIWSRLRYGGHQQHARSGELFMLLCHRIQIQWSRQAITRRKTQTVELLLIT